jgi:general stress protein YciG
MRCSPSISERDWRSEEGKVAKEDRGFASMDRSKQREIASKGGKAAHQKGTAHEWTSEEAREAGRKGGMASHRRKQEGGGPSSSTEVEETAEQRGGSDVRDEGSGFAGQDDMR